MNGIEEQSAPEWEKQLADDKTVTYLIIVYGHDRATAPDKTKWMQIRTSESSVSFIADTFQEMAKADSDIFLQSPPLSISYSED